MSTIARPIWPWSWRSRHSAKRFCEPHRLTRVFAPQQSGKKNCPRTLTLAKRETSSSPGATTELLIRDSTQKLHTCCQHTQLHIRRNRRQDRFRNAPLTDGSTCRFNQNNIGYVRII